MSIAENSYQKLVGKLKKKKHSPKVKNHSQAFNIFK